YSYGITKGDELENSKLELYDLNINETKPYYTRIPIGNLSKEDKNFFKVAGNAKMIINDEEIGTHNFSNPTLQSLKFIFSLLGIGLISIIVHLLKFIKSKR